MSQAQSPIHAQVQAYYGQTLQSSQDLKTNACCASGSPPAWLGRMLGNVHDDVMSRFYGCGFPFAEAVEGATVLDLGCGTGRDVYVLSQMVGPQGMVHGVDMTPEQLAVARGTVDWHMARFGFTRANVAFHEGVIEDMSALPIASGSVDVIVSNCVVNLSPRKDLVLAEAWRLLKPGGEFYFSDVFCDRRLPPEVANDPLLHGECLGGALYLRDFVAMARRAGFVDPREVSTSPITVNSPELEARLGQAGFTSVTWRLFKLPELDDACEDYGHVATYKGTIAQLPDMFTLDDHHIFETGRPERICRNTALMLGQTRLAAHFDIIGGQSRHFGAFDCSATMAATAHKARQAQLSGQSPGGGACC